MKNNIWGAGPKFEHQKVFYWYGRRYSTSRADFLWAQWGDNLTYKPGK